MRPRSRVRFEGAEESPALTPSWRSATWNQRPGAVAGADGGLGSPRLGGDPDSRPSDAEMQQVEEQVRGPSRVRVVGLPGTPGAEELLV